MVDGLLVQLLQQRLAVPEPVLDQLGELSVGLLALGRGEALPEEAVVPQLRAVVEQLRVAGTPRLADDLGERGSAQALVAADQLVGLGDIGLVVLAVMELERFGRHVRRERVLGKEKIGQLEGHGEATP